MMKFCVLCVLVLCVVQADAVVSFTSVNCTKSPNCPLFNLGSNIVTLEDVQREVEGVLWMLMYYVEFNEGELFGEQDFGKCNVLWHAPNADNLVRSNFAKKDCDDFEVYVKRKVLDCGRAEKNSVYSTMDAKFYSQDLTHYFWYDQCYEYNDINECKLRYLVLMVKKSRVLKTKKTEELDIHALPWDLISADLKNNFDLTLANGFVKFNQIGPECGFDGKIIRTRGQCRRRRPTFQHLMENDHTVN